MEGLPEGWKENRINVFCKIISGSTPNTNVKEYWDGDILWITPKDLSGYSNKFIENTSRKITKKGYDSCSAKLIPENNVLMSSRAPIGYLVINKKPICTNQGFKSFLIEDKNKLNEEFLYYQLMHIVEKIKKSGSGTTFNEISKTKAESIVIRLPLSIEEQKLIVQEIEKQFSRLDETLRSLKSTKEKLKTYRKTTLKNAFLGELTSNLGHTKETIGSIISDIRYGTSKKCNFDNTLTPVLRIPNIIKGEIDTSELKYCQFTDEELEKLRLKTGDILVIRSNGSKNLVGRSAIVPETFENYSFAGYLIRLRLKNELIHPKFFNYFFQSGFIREQIEKKAKSTSGVNNVNAKEICSMKIHLFPIEGQEKIVEEIESRFSIIDKLEETVNQSLDKTEKLRKSILKTAFEGKLVKYEAN